MEWRSECDILSMIVADRMYRLQLLTYKHTDFGYKFRIHEIISIHELLRIPPNPHLTSLDANQMVDLTHVAKVIPQSTALRSICPNRAETYLV